MLLLCFSEHLLLRLAGAVNIKAVLVKEDVLPGPGLVTTDLQCCNTMPRVRSAAPLLLLLCCSCVEFLAAESASHPIYSVLNK